MRAAGRVKFLKVAFPRAVRVYHRPMEIAASAAEDSLLRNLPQEFMARPGVGLWQGVDLGAHRSDYVSSAVSARGTRCKDTARRRVWRLQLDEAYETGSGQIYRGRRRAGPYRPQPSAVRRRGQNIRCPGRHERQVAESGRDSVP